MKWYKKQSMQLQLIAFISGFSLMAFELVAARILAPTIGSSTYVWTSVIGVIIAALSLGYYAGGKLADKRHQFSDVIILCFLAAGCVVGMSLIYYLHLEWVARVISDPRLQALVASVVLFAPTSFVLGALSPYLVKLKVTSLTTSGQSVASLSALNSVGGIIGTFATGFIFFGYIGSRETLIVVVMLLLLSSWMLQPRRFFWQRAGVSFGLLLVVAIPSQASEGFVRIDTPSAHYEVLTGTIGERDVTALVTGPNGTQSAVYNDGSQELVFWYTREIARIVELKSPRTILVLGGGAFTLPQYLATKLPDSQVDAVEIDPELESIATTYFNYRALPNSNLIFDDARAYLNTTDTQYEVIIVDVYGDNSIPFQLMTKEYGQQISRHLAPGGSVIANVIAGTTGRCAELLGAVSRSYSQELPHALYSTQSGRQGVRANHIIVYSKIPQELEGMEPLTTPNLVSYSDNYTPAERLHHGCQQNS